MNAEGPELDLPELYAEAEELDGVARARFLEEVAARSPAVADELRELLAAADRSTPWLNAPAWRPSASGGLGPLPAAIGPYRVVSEVGRGGAGRVFLAEEEGDGFTRRVAVKVLTGALHGAEAIERFRAEGRLLAGLEHPGIARLYDAGTTAEGISFLAMEFVDGPDLVHFAQEKGLSTRQRVELFLQVLESVQFAHRHLIVHRDLKPANLLVDSTGQVKLLDFGIARLVEDAESGAEAALTRTGQRWLTPAYASPEQILGERTTTAADIYSLGVVLYELLAGCRPYAATGQQLESAVLNTEPPPPSRPTGAVRPVSSAAAGEIRGDLDAITLYALRKEPEARYRSAEAFAEDLRRYLGGFPVLARQGTRRYRWSKFVRRNRGSLAAAAAVLLALGTGLGSALWQARRAAEAQSVAERRFADLQGLASAMIFEVTDAIAPLDGAAPVMELTLDRALEYLNRLEADGGQDLLEELAAGYERVGRISTGLPAFGRGTGRLAQGVAAFEHAVALRRKLAGRPGAQPDAHVSLGRCLTMFCDALRASRDPQRAEAVCGEAIAVLDAVMKDHPDQPDWQLELATAMAQRLLVQGAIAGSAVVLGSPEADRAGDLWLKLGANAPETLRKRHNFAWGAAFMSHLLGRSGKPEAALQLAQQAVRSTEGPVTSNFSWDDGFRQKDRGEALEAAAYAHWGLGQREEALRYFQQAYALRLAALRKDRQQQLLIQMFNIAGNIATLCGEMGSVECGEKALADERQLVDDAVGVWKPDTVTWSRGLAATDQGRFYRTLLERPDLPKNSRRKFADRGREAFSRAIGIFETLVQGGEDRFGVGDTLEECREGVEALSRHP